MIYTPVELFCTQYVKIEEKLTKLRLSFLACVGKLADFRSRCVMALKYRVVFMINN